MRQVYTLKNYNTGSELTFDPENPPSFVLEWVTVQDGQLVLCRGPISELPPLVQEFLQTLSKRNPPQDGAG